MLRALSLALSLALLLLVWPAHADLEPALPNSSFIVAARFPNANPTTVVADVLEIGGSQIGNDVATTRAQLDSANTDTFYLDLDSVTGFATSCTRKVYLVRFIPDSADCTGAASPFLCPEQIVTSGGLDCQNSGAEPSVVFPTVPIPSRGITQAVINRGNPSYIKHEVKIPDGGTVAFTWYQVFYYDASGRVERSPRSLTVPNP